jgi:hypothetical protein
MARRCPHGDRPYVPDKLVLLRFELVHALRNLQFLILSHLRGLNSVYLANCVTVTSNGRICASGQSLLPDSCRDKLASRLVPVKPHLKIPCLLLSILENGNLLAEGVVDG